jgi:NitT/TauT family transport system substrate-binding protein
MNSHLHLTLLKYAALCWAIVLLAANARPAGADDAVSVGMVRLPTAIFVALDRGYFRAESLRVSTVFSQSGGELVPALSTGRIDVAIASPGAALFNALAIGVSAKIVADCWVAPNGATPHDYAYMSVRSDLIRAGRFVTARDARGMTIAITARGQMTELFARAFLRHAGLRLADVHLVQLPFPDMEAALRNHAVDLATMMEPYATISADAGSSVNVTGIGALMPGYVQAVVLYGDRLTVHRRDIGERFMRAFARANRWLRNAQQTPAGRRQLARIYQQYLPLDDPAIYARIGLPLPPRTLAVHAGGAYGLAWQLRQYRAAGLVPVVPDLRAAIDPAFLAMPP